jgi:hypothetical protein
MDMDDVVIAGPSIRSPDQARGGDRAESQSPISEGSSQFDTHSRDVELRGTIPPCEKCDVMAALREILTLGCRDRQWAAVGRFSIHVAEKVQDPHG